MILVRFCFVSVYGSAYAFRYISFNIGIIVRVSLFVCQSGISVYFSSILVYFIVFPCIIMYLSIHLFPSLSAPLFKPKMNDRTTDEILRCWISYCLLPRATIVKYKSYGNWTIANRKMMPAAQTQNRKVNPAPQTNESSHIGNMMLPRHQK